MDNITQPGLYLQTGPPINLVIIATTAAGELLRAQHDLTPQQAASLGSTLLRLAGCVELLEQAGSAETDDRFLRDAGVQP